MWCGWGGGGLFLVFLGGSEDDGRERVRRELSF